MMTTVPPTPRAILVTLLICAGLGLSCGKEQSRPLTFSDFTLTRNPKSPPPVLPSLFHYPGARLVRSGVYQSSRVISPREGVLVMTTDDAPEIIVRTYRKLLKASGWSIIQTRNAPSERLIMTESPSPRHKSLMTVIVRGGKPTVIKIYFKRSET